jgi:hypothetical protein
VNQFDIAHRLRDDLTRALEDLTQAREAASVGEDARRAVPLLRGLLRLVNEVAAAQNADLDPYWRMAELILDSVPAVGLDLPATTTGGTR